MISLSPQPIILFDGLCNLCNGAVAWIITRDRARTFRFASLQSRAGQEVIAAAGFVGQLPDSIVLVDAADGKPRLRTRSDATIGIARHLGFPWMLASLALILPRVLRDGLYSWVAANRYRWFGRQSACMVPTPELRSRFLDADEPPVVRAELPTIGKSAAVSPSAAVLHGTAATNPLAATATFLHRLLLAYLFIYIFPFPVGDIPYTSWLDNQYQNVLRPTVQFVGRTVFGAEITVMPNGSGDTTYNYIEVFIIAALAILGTIAWTLWKRAAPVSPRVHDVMTVYVRYCLAMNMFTYGWDKVFPNQMPLPGPDRLMGTIGEMSPMGLVWTFMGAGTAYQIFAGACEVLGGLLLLSRRTALGGALISAGVMANVVALNFCYDVPVKLLSSHLLLFALFLCIPHGARILAILLFNLPAQPVVLRPFPFNSTWARRTALAAKLGLIYLIVILPAYGNWKYMTTNGLLAPHKPWHGFYRVVSFTRDGITDRALEDTERWVRVGIDSGGVGAIQRADGSTRHWSMEVDKAKGTLNITRRDEPKDMTLSFAMPAADIITLTGTFEGKPISATLKRSDDAPPLLTHRGFHWINEFPLYR